MKLYTKLEVSEAMTLARLTDDSEGDIFKELTPIELPSDEEIYVYINSLPYTKYIDDGRYNNGVRKGVELGIEWMKNKIQGGNI